MIGRISCGEGLSLVVETESDFRGHWFEPQLEWVGDFPLKFIILADLRIFFKESRIS